MFSLTLRAFENKHDPWRTAAEEGVGRQFWRRSGYSTAHGMRHEQRRTVSAPHRTSRSPLAMTVHVVVPVRAKPPALGVVAAAKRPTEAEREVGRPRATSAPAAGAFGHQRYHHPLNSLAGGRIGRCGRVKRKSEGGGRRSVWGLMCPEVLR